MPALSRLRELRLRRALSQRDLAKLSGVAQTTIVRLEAGNAAANPSTMRKLAKALKISPADLWEQP